MKILILEHRKSHQSRTPQCLLERTGLPSPCNKIIAGLQISAVQYLFLLGRMLKIRNGPKLIYLTFCSTRLVLLQAIRKKTSQCSVSFVLSVCPRRKMLQLLNSPEQRSLIPSGMTYQTLPNQYTNIIVYILSIIRGSGQYCAEMLLFPFHLLAKFPWRVLGIFFQEGLKLFIFILFIGAYEQQKSCVS